jgi:hypothetical protein
MDQSRSRELEDIIKGVKGVARRGAITPAALEHMALLVVVLQIASRVVTNLLQDTNTWWSVTRDAGLNTLALFADAIPPDLMEAAAAATDDTFWSSDAVTPYYWPMHVRLMLAGDDSVAKRASPGDFLAMSFRVTTVAKVARRLFGMLTQVLECSATAAANTTLKLVHIKLAAFLREPLAPSPDVDYDPRQLNSRALLLAQFAGPVARLHPEARNALSSTLAEIEAQHGAGVRETILAAATKAGFLAETQFHTEGMSAVSAVSMGGLRDCGLLLLTQEPSLKVLLDVLAWLEHKVNDEKTYDSIMEAEDDATPTLYRVENAHIDPVENAANPGGLSV